MAVYVLTIIIFSKVFVNLYDLCQSLMIKPKHTFHSPDSIVFNEKLFVDREAAKKKFADFIERNQKDYNILMYYGIGGIGKSRLLAENISYFKERYHKTVCFSVDFNDVNKRSVGETLAEFVDDCSNHEIPFVAYNLAYAIYFSKKHSGEEYGRNKNTIGNRFSGFLDIIGVWDNGRVRVAVDLITRVVDFAKKNALDEMIQEDLKSLKDLSLTEIEQRLPSYFQYDLSRYLAKNPDVHVLFTIDTFEALNVQQTEEIHRRRNEDWVQDMIAHFPNDSTPNCSFVICGRDELNWEDEWDEYIAQVELTDFTKKWAGTYLEEVGVQEPEIRAAIIRASQGLPFYLYLSAKTYIDIKNKGAQPRKDDFEGDHKQIIQRFIYNLSDDEVRTLKYLAIPRFFTQEIFEYLLSHFKIACDPERFEQITAYSFIQEPIDERYYIHALMREGLIKNTAEKSYNQVNALMHKYYEELYSRDKDKQSFSQMVYHAAAIKDIEEFKEWFFSNAYNTVLKDLQMLGEQADVFSITENLIKRYGTQQLSNEVVNIYIDMLHLGGDYEAAVKTCENYLSSFSQDEIIKDEGLCRMRIRQIHHSMFFTPVDELITKTKAIVGRKNVDKYPEQYNELLFLLGGNLGVLSGEFEKAGRWLNKALNYSQKTQRINFTLRNVRKLADLDTYNGHPDTAIKRIERYLTVDSKIDKRYEIYLLASLGEVYRKRGDLTIASKCFDIVKNKSQEKNVPGWIAHAILAQCMVLYEKNLCDAAIPVLEDVIRRYKAINHVWGEINGKTLLLLCKARMGEEGLADEAKELRIHADRMNYRYNVGVLDAFISESGINYFQLFFL